MEKIIFAEVDVEKMVESAKIIVESLLDRKIADADPIMLLIKSFIAIIAQQRQIIDEAANQNLLFYSTGVNLEKIGELVGVSRLPATAATCTVEITLSTARIKQTVIPAGIRITTSDGVTFALDDDVIFLSGETVKTAKATCTEFGEIGNNCAAGEICRIVDYAPYLCKIENITVSEGGADIEDDESLRERIRIAPSSFSVAGSKEAYIFWTKDFNSEIIDAMAVSPEPGYVDIYFLTAEGVPQTEMIEGVQNYLSDEKIRPLTDFVTVKAPDVVSYDIDVEYYISRENKTRATSIIENVESAVEIFALWQKNKLGRDISPTELNYRLRAAGADRVIINLPHFTEIAPNAVAICQNINVTYKGLKDA